MQRQIGKTFPRSIAWKTPVKNTGGLALHKPWLCHRLPWATSHLQGAFLDSIFPLCPSSYTQMFTSPGT